MGNYDLKYSAKEKLLDALFQRNILEKKLGQRGAQTAQENSGMPQGGPPPMQQPAQGMPSGIPRPPMPQNQPPMGGMGPSGPPMVGMGAMKTAGQIGSRLGNRGKQPFDGVPQGNGPNIRQRVEPHIGNTWKAQSADFGPGNNAGAAVGQGIRERLQPNMGQTWRQSDGVSMSQQEIEALAARLGKQIQEITDQDIMAAKAGQI